MQPIRLAAASATPALVLALMLAAPAQAQETTRCQSPASAVDRVACDKARQGPETLRRFVQRTQPTLMLHFWDYMSPSELDKHYAQQPRQEQRATEQDRKSG